MKPLRTIPTLAYVISQYQEADQDNVWQRTPAAFSVNEIINYDHPEKVIAFLLKNFCSMISLPSDKEDFLIGVQCEIDTMLQGLKPKPKQTHVFG